jgi:hypothetical protein
MEKSLQEKFDALVAAARPNENNPDGWSKGNFVAHYSTLPEGLQRYLHFQMPEDASLGAKRQLFQPEHHASTRDLFERWENEAVNDRKWQSQSAGMAR